VHLKKVTVGINRKVNLGNYETKDYYLSAEVDVEEGENLKTVSEELKSSIEALVDAWEAELKGEESTLKPATELVKKEELEEGFICPKDNEEMKKAEGKEYYLCSKHWGYPDMIRKGEVRERKF
jgi:hypothetical protein